ncbi:LRR domain containing protein [Parasponia andersonii]|uniref:LRR domain containing protein n=1 Tax=Parasponia andersonii TaxID=3476 RepID=A0A2P5BCV2_PARAD|nr:LRR domain containing protein [Parasponia andersonii]
MEPDLSNNNLSGIIPSQLVDLKNLTELNLSYNSLQGPIRDEILKRFLAKPFIGNDNLWSDMLINVLPRCSKQIPNKGIIAEIVRIILPISIFLGFIVIGFVLLRKYSLPNRIVQHDDSATKNEDLLVFQVHEPKKTSGC